MPDFDKREKMLLGILLIMSVLAGCITYYAFFKPSNEIVLDLQGEQDKASLEDNETFVEEKEKIVVHVAGAVNNPGVYTLEEGDRVKDALDIAGGVIPEADLECLNLALKVHDEDKLYVPKIGEIADSPDSSKGSSIAGISSNDDGKININTASEAELTQLPGIGPVTAQKIIDYRESNGKFSNVEDIKNVSGIGDKKFEQIKDKIKTR